MIAAAPDLILASWCAMEVAPARIAGRPRWDSIPSVRAGRIVEINSPLILQPGPAALMDRLDAIQRRSRARDDAIGPRVRNVVREPRRP